MVNVKWEWDNKPDQLSPEEWESMRQETMKQQLAILAQTDTAETPEIKRWYKAVKNDQRKQARRRRHRWF